VTRSTHIAALDQGTTSTRCLIFDRQGRIVGSDQRPHEQITPHPGWVEHDPEEIVARAREVVATAIAKAGLEPKDVAALGITNQRETTVVWDRRTGRPYGNAIVWQDTRTEALCAQLAGEGLAGGDTAHGDRDRFREQTGLPLATYFSGPKIRWILDHVTGARQAAERGDALAGTIDSWLVWRLTGGPRGGAHVTDPTNASRTMLMNLATLAWEEDLLAAIGVPRNILPEIRPSSDPRAYGHTAEGIPIHGILGDQQAALVGQACFAPGEAKNTYGTGCFLLLNTGHAPVASDHGLLSTVAYQLGDAPAVYALEGSVAIAGALVQWLRDQLGLIATSEEVEARAGRVADSGGAYIVPAFSGLFAPHWRPDARGVITGLTRYVNRDHLCRAALEATALQVEEVVQAMRRDAELPLAVLKVDGGMVVNDLLMQIQSDLLDTPVVRPAVIETTALGAAYAAGLAVGLWPDQDTLREHWREERRWVPDMAPVQRETLLDGWRKAVARSLDWTTT
jgi:glycerol kinase